MSIHTAMGPVPNRIERKSHPFSGSLPVLETVCKWHTEKTSHHVYKRPEDQRIWSIVKRVQAWKVSSVCFVAENMVSLHLNRRMSNVTYTVFRKEISNTRYLPIYRCPQWTPNYVNVLTGIQYGMIRWVHGHLKWKLWNVSSAYFLNFIWKGHECKILLVIWIFEIVFDLIAVKVYSHHENTPI